MRLPVPKQTPIELGEGKSLLFQESTQQSRDYPTWRLQKGSVLVVGNNELAEEGLGFDVPLLKFGDQNVFPGTARTSFNIIDGSSIIEVDYDLDFIKKLTRQGRKIKSRTIYRVEAYLGWLHREYPLLREAGDRLFGQLRHFFGIKSVFEKGVSAGNIRVVYTIPQTGSTLNISVDLSNLKRDGLTEIIIENEQGASYFDGYRDSNGMRLSGKRIGTWDEVIAERASFVDSGNHIIFTIIKVRNARLFRGREFAPGRLAWSGLNYVLPPDTTAFDYDIELGTAE